MDCPRCGNPVEMDSAFCSNCGLKISQTTPALDPAPVQGLPRLMNRRPSKTRDVVPRSWLLELRFSW